MKLSEVHLNPENPRFIKDDKFKKLCQSIKEFPKMLELRPIIVDSTGLILGGNMRFRALQELKMPLKEEWVKEGELTEIEKRRFIVEDNVGFGDWDWDKLANEYEKEELEDWGMDIDKWKDDEVVEDEVPEITDNPVSKLGEVYQLGRHKVMCGDSTKIEDVEKLMDGKKADMVFTDPPYGVDYEGGLANSKKREKLIGDTGDITELFESALTNAVAVTIDKSAYYVFFSFDNKNVSRVLASVKKSGLKIKALLIWHKINAGFGSLNHRYKQKHEPFLYCCKEKFAENFYGPTNEVTVWDLKRDGRNEYHLTQKPVELVARAVKNSSKEENIVLDLFLGSGSTLIACEQTNRICYGMEISEAYCDVIRKRWAKFTNPDTWEEQWQKLTPKVQ